MEKLQALTAPPITIRNTPHSVRIVVVSVCASRSALSAEREALCFFPFNSPISSLMELRGEFYSVQLCKLSLKLCALCLRGIGARHAHNFASRGCNTESGTLPS